MPKAQGAPVTEIENVTMALAQWLRREGFSPEPTDVALPEAWTAAEKLAYGTTPECIFHGIDVALVRQSPRAIAVHVALGYLLGTALRAHRREAERAKLEAELGPGDVRVLARSGTQAAMGQATRAILGPITHLEKWLKKWEAEQELWAKQGFPRREDVRIAYDAFLKAGQELLRAIEPPSVDSGVLALPVPWTMDDWREIAVDLEMSLFEAGFTDPEIAPLFGRSGPELVTQARYRRSVASSTRSNSDTSTP